MTQAPVKLSAEQRRAAIIKAVRRVFAEKGFHGTTTRELANSAGVSEALLFKHFPNKEALFSAMQVSCCNDRDNGTVGRLKSLEPSASTLVLLVHWIVSHMIEGRRNGSDEDDQDVLQTRLLLRSLTEDGEFARHFLRGGPSQGARKLEECIKAAIAAGDALEGPVRPALSGWFAQHLAAMIKIHLLPSKPVVDYNLSQQKLVEQAVWFILRGMGLKEQAIRRYYNPKALALLSE
jgi:AcrR family transcriptional regulator